MPEGVAAATVADNVSSVVVGVFKYDVGWSFVACRSNAVTLTVTVQRKYTSSIIHYICFNRPLILHCVTTDQRCAAPLLPSERQQIPQCR
jgi:hypothetical protein